MKTKSLFVLICFLGVISTARAANEITGNGVLVTQEKEITDYNKVKIDGLFDVYYQQTDDAPYFEITVDENILPFVNLQLKDRMLTVQIKGAKVEKFTKCVIRTNSKWLKEIIIAGNGNFITESPLHGDELSIKASNNSLVQIKYPVEMGRLNLTQNGGSNIVIDELTVDHLDPTTNGKGSITLKSGNAKEGTYSVTGGGEIRAYGAEVKDLSCRVTGGGSAQVQASESLKLNLMGNGSIRYKGNAEVKQMKKVGKGTIERVE